MKARFPDDGGRIIEIRDCDPAAHRSKLQEVQRLMDADMGFAPGARDDDGQQSGGSGGRCRDGSFAPKIEQGETPRPPIARRKAVNAFLYIRGKRVLGCVVAERIVSARRAVPEIQCVVRPSTEGVESAIGDIVDGVGSGAAGGGTAGGQGENVAATGVLQPATTTATNAVRGGLGAGVGGSGGGDTVATDDHGFARAATNGRAGNPAHDCGKASADGEMGGGNHRENESNSAPANAGSESPPSPDGGGRASGVRAALDSSTDGCCDSQPEDITTEQAKNNRCVEPHELPVLDSADADVGVPQHFRGSQLRDWSSGRVVESKDDDGLCFDAARGRCIEANYGSPAPMLTPEHGDSDGTTQNPTAISATAPPADGLKWGQVDPDRETVSDQGGRAVHPVSADGRTPQDPVDAKEKRGARATSQYEGKMGTTGAGAERCNGAAASADEGESLGGKMEARRGGLWAYFGKAKSNAAMAAAGGGNTTGENGQRTEGKRGVEESFGKSDNEADGVEHPGNVVSAASPNGSRSPDETIKLTPHPDGGSRPDDGYEANKKRKLDASGTKLLEAIDTAAVGTAAEDCRESHGGGSGGAGRGDRGGRRANVAERGTGDPLQQTLSRFFSATPHRLATAAESSAAAPEATSADSTVPPVAGEESTSSHNSAASGESALTNEDNFESEASEKRQEKSSAAEHGSTITGDESRSGGDDRGGTTQGKTAAPEVIRPQQDRRADLEEGRTCNDGGEATTGELSAMAETGGSSNEVPLTIMNRAGEGRSGEVEGQKGSRVTTLAAAVPAVVAVGRDRAFSMDSDDDPPSCPTGRSSKMRKKDVTESGCGADEEEAVPPLPSAGLSVEDEEVPAVVGILQVREEIVMTVFF